MNDLLKLQLIKLFSAICITLSSLELCEFLYSLAKIANVMLGKFFFLLSTNLTLCVCVHVGTSRNI